MLFLLCFVAAVSTVYGQPPTAGPAVKLFDGRDAAGAKQDIPPGTYIVNGKQMSGTPGKETVYSIQVPKGFHVRFCDEKGPNAEGEGNCEDYDEGTHNLKSNKFNFIKVWMIAMAAPATPADPPVIVFEQLNWGGRQQVYRPGMYRSIKGEFGRINDNMAMSIIVATGFQVRLCSDEGINMRGSGDCEVHDEGRHNLRFSNAISFIEVRDLSDKSPDDTKMPVILYEDGAQAGRMQGFDVGVFLASQNQFGKVGADQASSITVKKGFQAIVCSDEGPAGGAPGKCEEFAAGKHNLKNRRAASYLKVSKADNQ